MFTSKENIKTIGIAVFAAVVGGSAAVMVSGSPAVASPPSGVGVVNYSEVIDRTAEAQGATLKLQEAIQHERDELNAKSANLSDEEKAVAVRQAQANIEQKRQELIAPIKAKVDAKVQSVAQEQGLNVVIDGNAVVYGGTDITKTVINNMAE